MSRPAHWDKATGRLASRHAAALSGNVLPQGCATSPRLKAGIHSAPRRGEIIRAGARIAAGAMPGHLQLGKGSAWESQSLLDRSAVNSPCRGLRASAFPFPLCGGPSLRGTREAAADAALLPGVGRQPFHDARQYAVDALETHFTPPNFSRRPTSARTGLRDLRNVTAPPVITEDDRGAVANARPVSANPRHIVVPHLFE